MGRTMSKAAPMIMSLDEDNIDIIDTSVNI